MDYRDLIKRNNRGVLFEERDNSVYSVTRFNNRISLVVGCSSKGVINSPVLVVSPENFTEIFGSIDYSLERKGSYFHRTVLNMLRHGPVMCVNLRLTDDALDKYNWVSLSTSASQRNGATRTSPVSDFYDVSSGFWKRSLDKIQVLNRQTSPDQQRLLHMVNLSDKPLSLLLYHSDLSGFDVPVEDWYASDALPAYVHPKELVSDYLLQAIAVEGRWNNYPELSVHPKWGKYFDRFGIIKEQVSAFLDNPEVQLIRKWTVSLLPYFQDKKGRDLYISSVINDDINETGLFVSYDLDAVETEYPNRLLDVRGDSLIHHSIGKVDYLSYKRNITDFFVLEEKFMDAPGNGFGDPLTADLNERTLDYAEGYVHNVRFNTNLFPATASADDAALVTPFAVDVDSYAVLNGKKIDLSTPVVHGLSVFSTLQPGYKFTYFLYLTEQGIQYRVTTPTGIAQFQTLPTVNNQREIVLGYFEVAHALNGTVAGALTPVALDTEGFRNVFKPRLVVDDAAPTDDAVMRVLNKINLTTFAADHAAFRIVVTASVPLANAAALVSALQTRTGKPVTLSYAPGRTGRVVTEILGGGDGVRVDVAHSSPTEFALLFEGSAAPNPFDYNQGRIYHLWYWLSNTVQEKESLVVNATGSKTKLSFVELGDAGTDRRVTLGVSGNDPLSDQWGIYINDIEFLVNGNQNGGLNPAHLGADSGLVQSYLSGDINSGDPFFYSLGDEEEVTFVREPGGNRIIIREPSFLTYSGKIIVQGTQQNDSLFTVVSCAIVGVEVHIEVAEDVVNETVPHVAFYNGSDVKKLDIAFHDGKISATIEPLDANPVDFYNQAYAADMQGGEWKRTLDVDKVYRANLIGVNLDRYVGFLKIGYHLLAVPLPLTDYHAEAVRNTTRIVDIYASKDEPGILIIETDAAVDVTAQQTECVVPMPQWVGSLDFKVLEPFMLRRAALPDGSEDQQNRILGLLGVGTKLASALSSERMEWRYLIDSFGGGLTPGSKQALAQLCEKRQGAIVFANFPSIRSLRDSTRPVFTTQGMLDTKLLLQGGARMSSGGERFALTSAGQSHIVYCAPYVAVRERGRLFHVPPASYVAGTYMLKFNAPQQLQPWTLMCGVENGRIRSIAGLEEVFNEDDLADFDTLGVTVITTYKNIAYHLYNQTTAAPMGSVLREVNVREALIELEYELRQALLPFQWKALTPYYRTEMKDAVDAVCARYRQGGAVRDFRNAVVLPDNEREEQVVYVNTEVEVAKGVRLLLARITINTTNTIG